MKRTPIGTEGKWFDIDKATKYDEGTTWNGSNHISMATGTQTEHEVLYRTAGGRWILHAWSQWQGSAETYEIISDKQAASWLIRSEYQDIPELLTNEVKEYEII